MSSMCQEGDATPNGKFSVCAKASAKLDSKYVLGELIAEGSFGAVWSCARQDDPKDFRFAVKMIDKAESTISDISNEIDVMSLLRHPNIVAYQDVFWEPFFVCVVMDRYTGGDLLEGMQNHWTQRGMIRPHDVVGLIRQMVMAIHHVHTHNFIHRDIKGDNFLMDRPGIVDSELQVALADFGTTCEAPDQKRFSHRCGTQVYWAPEFHRGDYSLPVDMFALGVVVYGMYMGRFPFKDEVEATLKEPALPDTMAPECCEFSRGLLVKDEGDRLSSAGALSHPWIATTEMFQEKTSTVPMEFVDIHREGASLAVKNRRQVLLERMKASNNRKHTQSVIDLPAERFVIEHHPGIATQYEWWSEERMGGEMALPVRGAFTETDREARSRVAFVEQVMKEYNVPAHNFGIGEAKSLAEFTAEVTRGAATLMQDASQHKKLVRVVDVVLIRLVSVTARQAGRLLVVSSEHMLDGRIRSNLNWLPGRKRDPHESLRRVVENVIRDDLGLPLSAVSLDLDGRESFEEERSSRSYPGVHTVYRKEIVSGELRSTDLELLSRLGLQEEEEPEVGFERRDKKGVVREFEWLGEYECKRRGVAHKKQAHAAMSALVMVAIGYGEEDLHKLLVAGGVDVSRWGKNCDAFLRGLSAELALGSAMLGSDDNGRPVRITEIVLLRLRMEGGRVLVKVEESQQGAAAVPLRRLPGIKRRPDENPFNSIKRLLASLRIDENAIDLDPTSTIVEEETKDSQKYPGIFTIYRKRVIDAEFADMLGKP